MTTESTFKTLQGKIGRNNEKMQLSKFIKSENHLEKKKEFTILEKLQKNDYKKSYETHKNTWKQKYVNKLKIDYKKKIQFLYPEICLKIKLVATEINSTISEGESKRMRETLGEILKN